MVTKTSRIASSLHIADFEEEDEVDRWLKESEDRIRNDSRAADNLIFFEGQEIDEDRVQHDWALIVEKFDARRRACLIAGEDVELVKKDEEVEDGWQDDWKENELDKALAHTIDVFGGDAPKKEALGTEEEEDAEGRVRRALGSGEEVEEQTGPLPYGGKVYPGMPVRPRGLGTPRGDQLSGEIYRSAQMGTETPYGDGLQWGKFVTQKKHYRDKQVQ